MYKSLTPFCFSFDRDLLLYQYGFDCIVNNAIGIRHLHQPQLSAATSSAVDKNGKIACFPCGKIDFNSLLKICVLFVVNRNALTTAVDEHAS